MRALLSTAILLSLAATAEAGLPTLNFTCPGGIELHTDEGGPAYINGEEAKLRRSNDSYYEATRGGVTVSISINPDGSATVSYTGKQGANGICQDTSPRIGGSGSSGHQGHQGASRAERACRKAVAHEMGRDTKGIKVIGSEESQAGTSVRVSVPGAQAPWSCVIDTDGSVERVEYMGEG